MTMNNDVGGEAAASEWPAWRALFHGSVREALAAAFSVSKIGTQDTHAWERPIRYVADDNQGNVGIVEFRVDGAIAAVSARARDRLFHQVCAIEMAPSDLQGALARLCDLPLLRDGPGISTIFWTAGELIQSADNWQNTLHSGADLFQRELLADALWEPAGTAYYDLPANIAHVAMAVARRATVRSPLVTLSEDELRQLVAKGSEHESEALDLLMSDGLFEITRMNE